MVYDSNLVKLLWRQFPNNLVDVDGFYAEYQAKDYADLSKSKEEPAGKDKRESKGEKIFYEKNSKSIILMPDIMPIDMDGYLVDKERRNKQMCGFSGEEFKPVNIVGDWWNLYDSLEGDTWNFRNLGKFGFQNSVGDPKRQLIFQSVVKTSDEKKEPVEWCIVAGEGRGSVQNEKWNENQGFVFWIDENILPENVENELNFYLFTRNPYHRKQVANGIYVSVKGDDRIRVTHYIDVEDKGTIPPERRVLTQTEEGSLSKGKEIVEWGEGKTKVFAMMIVDKYILFGLNSLENCFVMECQNYDVGETPEGLNYPIILRDNAELQITGKGQALFGLKKLAYFQEGKIKIPEIKTGYQLSNPYQVTRVKRSSEDEVVRHWFSKGMTDENYNIYGEITLKGSPLSVNTERNDEHILRLNEYRKAHTEKTAQFLKTKFIDDQRRSVGEIELPGDIESEIISYTETASANENNIINDLSVSIDCAGSFEKMYKEILAYKQINGETLTQLRGKDTLVSNGKFIFRQPKVSISDFGNINLKLSGDETALFSLKRSIGYVISFDDRRITDVEAMKEVCEINNLPFVSDVMGKQLPETVEGKEGCFTFQPNVSFLEVLTGLAKIQGYNLFVDSGTVYYKKDKTAEDLTLGRSELYPVDNIEYENNDIYKSRILVIGRAGENTKDYKRGEKLIGVWKSRSKIEKEIGYDVFVKEDEILTDWAMVQAEGEKLWHRFNEKNYIIRFDVTDAIEYFYKIKLFNVFKWVDSGYDSINDKLFTITGYSKEISQSDCTANVTGILL